jgi:hypothetical protein
MGSWGADETPLVLRRQLGQGNAGFLGSNRRGTTPRGGLGVHRPWHGGVGGRLCGDPPDDGSLVAASAPRVVRCLIR